MKTQILQFLKNEQGYLSGQELCDHFSVSRTAIWKIIKQLQEEGYEIEAVRNRGYRLVNIPDILSSAELESRMTTDEIGRKVLYFDKIDSTNKYAKQYADDYPNGTLVVAGMQTSGRGRRGRSWDSPPETGIFMTLLLKPSYSPVCASMTTLIAALAIRDAIYEVTGLEGSIKWPNDVVINGKKVCGILTEMAADPDMIQYIVIGCGINVNTTSFPEEIAGTATSLYLESGKKQNRAELIASIMKQFELYYDRFLQTEDLSLIKESYEAHLVNLNREVTVLAPSGKWRGISRGITPTGELYVENDKGELQTVLSGEVSVRGVYGYV